MYLGKLDKFVLIFSKYEFPPKTQLIYFEREERNHTKSQSFEFQYILFLAT